MRRIRVKARFQDTFTRIRKTKQIAICSFMSAEEQWINQWRRAYLAARSRQKLVWCSVVTRHHLQVILCFIAGEFSNAYHLHRSRWMDSVCTTALLMMHSNWFCVSLRFIMSNWFQIFWGGPYHMRFQQQCPQMTSNVVQACMSRVRADVHVSWFRMLGGQTSWLWPDVWPERTSWYELEPRDVSFQDIPEFEASFHWLEGTKRSCSCPWLPDKRWDCEECGGSSSSPGSSLSSAPHRSVHIIIPTSLRDGPGEELGIPGDMHDNPDVESPSCRQKSSAASLLYIASDSGRKLASLRGAIGMARDEHDPAARSKRKGRTRLCEAESARDAKTVCVVVKNTQVNNPSKKQWSNEDQF